MSPNNVKAGDFFVVYRGKILNKEWRPSRFSHLKICCSAMYQASSDCHAHLRGE